MAGYSAVGSRFGEVESALDHEINRDKETAQGIAGSWVGRKIGPTLAVGPLEALMFIC